MTSVHHSYRPGSGWAVAAPDVVALGGGDTPMEVLAALWGATGAGADPQELIDTVLGAGLRRLPDFGFVHRSEDVVHVLVRGQVEAEIVDDDGADPELLTAASALTWVEQAVPVGASVVLRVAVTEAGGWLPVAGGIVQASAITIGPEASAGSVSALAGGLADMPDPVPAADPDGQRAGWLAGGPKVVDGPADQPIAVEPDAEPPPVGAPNAELSDGGVEGAVDGAVDPVEQELPVSSGPADPSGGENSADDGSMTLAAIPDADGTGTGSSLDDPAPDVDDFEDLFGATRAPVPVEQAAVRPEVDGDGVGNTPVAGGAPVTVADPQLPVYPPEASLPAGPAPEPVVTQPPAATTGLISSVPINPAVPASVPAPPPAARPADAQEDPAVMTVSRAYARELRGGPSLGTAVAGGPPVHGVRCVNGHPNPPAATHCRLCDGMVAETEPVTMPRPVLGALAFSNGMRVALDRSAVIGRSPRTERVSVNEIPQLVVVPSPESDISRSHLEVRLEGWHVIVIDLGSTNGTVVTLPGQAPERIRPHEECPIVPGTTVSLADELSFTYAVEP